MTVIAAMTAFYMFRLYYGIFWGSSEPGQKSASDESHSHQHTPHESPLAMTVPLMFLAAVTIVAGFIPFYHFVSSNGEAYTIHLDWGVAGTSIAIAVISIAVATFMYKGEKQPVADALARRFNGLWTAAYHRFYIDEVYQFITHRIIFGCISRPIAWWDRHVVDGFFDFLAWGANATSDEIRGIPKRTHPAIHLRIPAGYACTDTAAVAVNEKRKLIVMYQPYRTITINTIL